MFTGFTQKTSDFLWELAFHNERPWFQEHKEEFETFVNTPFKALADEVFSLMSARYPQYSFYPHVSRIYRDARRLFGRGPYKEKLWFSLKTEEKDYGGPVFWFEFGAADYAFGMGFWGTPEIIADYRAAIDANPAAFLRIVKQLEAVPELRIDGETYKRPKGDYEPPLDLWYNLKHPGLMFHYDFGGDLLRPELPQLLVERYGQMMPLFDFLMGIYNRSRKTRE